MQLPGNLEEKMKITSSSVQKDRKGNVAGNSETTTADGWESESVDEPRLEEMIAVAAYFRAERRGFAPGDELGDWFQAEAEYQAGVRSKMN